MRAFFDTNILVYTITADPRGNVARNRLGEGGVVSTQVLNEFVRVGRKKLRLGWAIIEASLLEFRALLADVTPIALSTHELAVTLAMSHGTDIYDALIIAAAIEAGCETLYSEDFQHGRRFGDLTIVNPFL